MRIAVTNENNRVFQHFGRCPSFIVFDVDEQKNIVHRAEVICGSVAHGALVNLLQDAQVDVVICGGLGLPMYEKLMQAHIQVFAGVEGNVDEVIVDYLNGTLDYDPDAHKNHGGCHHTLLN